MGVATAGLPFFLSFISAEVVIEVVVVGMMDGGAATAAVAVDTGGAVGPLRLASSNPAEPAVHQFA